MALDMLGTIFTHIFSRAELGWSVHVIGRSHSRFHALVCFSLELQNVRSSLVYAYLTHFSLPGCRLGLGRDSGTFRVPAPKIWGQRARSGWEVQFEEIAWEDVRPSLNPSGVGGSGVYDVLTQPARASRGGVNRPSVPAHSCRSHEIMTREPGRARVYL